jgi:type I restriction enzyme S subunit
MKLVDTTLANILDFYNGKVTKSSEQGNVPIYGSNGIIGLTNRKLYKDAIILGRVGAYCGSVMRCKDEFWASDNTIVVKPKQDIANINYCYYLLKNLNLNNYAGGAAQPLITQTTLKQIKIKIPNIDEQKRIANILSAYDDLIENNQKQIKLLEEAAMRLYKEWFVNLRFPGYENTKIVDGVPDGWSRKKLIDIADITMGQSPKSEYYNDRQQGLPFHQGVTNYGYRFVIDETYSTSYTRIAEAGSVLFSVRAPVGRMNITKNKIVIGRGLAAINHREGLQSFLFYMLKNRFYKDDLIGNGAIYASITKAVLHSQEFLIPCDNLANEFNSVAKSIDQQITNVDRQIILLQQARDKLLPKLMNGDIEV